MITHRIAAGIVGVLILTFAALLAGAQVTPPAPSPVTVRWLDASPPPMAQGVAFGVPWPCGALPKDAHFTLADAHGKNFPLQTWALAFWPDGSLKWTGHALAAPADLAGPFTISPGGSSAETSALKVNETADAIDVMNGDVSWHLLKKGASLVDSIRFGDTTVAKNGTLVCQLEDRSNYDNHHTTRQEDFVSDIESATLEQSGPVRAVVKFTGKHKSLDGGREWLPFSVRLYFYAGIDSVRMVHSIVFDGDQNKDFIRGLGVQFDVPMREQSHNRHVRFIGETGAFAEPVRIIAGRHFAARDLITKQIAGEKIPDLDQIPDRADVEQMAVWDDYKLVQISADSYQIQKRTNEKSAWINSAAGNRSLGTAFVGDTDGGLAIGMENFWQLSPTELEIDHASTSTAQLTLWLWSPESSAMDLRHYDTIGHGLDASYEDYQEGYSTATGVARTHEITLCPFKRVPSNETLLNLARATALPAHLVCTPEYYHLQSAFGIWSLPDRSTPAKRWIEDQLDRALAFYMGQVDQRRWYGFWDFGDVMHSYDPARHEWKYDVGGFAWDNTELVPNLWLWYSFLRTGRPDVFRFIEAMSRQTQEVDVYHLGPFAGLGSRHNVRHWGCGAKELRVSQALLKRPYYYLTTDERTGDLMREVVDADEKLVDVDPLRHIEPPSQYPTHIRIGPDWFAACSNWLAEWERTGDTKYRDKIVVGMNCIANFPHKFFSGDSYGYDPKTAKLYVLHPDKPSIDHLAALMGGPELCMEMNPLIDSPQWNEAYLNYCRYLQAPPDEQRKVLDGVVGGGRGSSYAKLTAYAAWATKDPMLAKRAWDEFFRAMPFEPTERFLSHEVTGPDVPEPIDEISFVSTNDTSQWSLNAIELLQLVGDALPKDVPTTGR